MTTFSPYNIETSQILPSSCLRLLTSSSLKKLKRFSAQREIYCHFLLVYINRNEIINASLPGLATGRVESTISFSKNRFLALKVILSGLGPVILPSGVVAAAGTAGGGIKSQQADISTKTFPSYRRTSLSIFHSFKKSELFHWKSEIKSIIETWDFDERYFSI